MSASLYMDSASFHETPLSSFLGFDGSLNQLGKSPLLGADFSTHEFIKGSGTTREIFSLGAILSP